MQRITRDRYLTPEEAAEYRYYFGISFKPRSGPCRLHNIYVTFLASEIRPTAFGTRDPTLEASRRARSGQRRWSYSSEYGITQYHDLAGLPCEFRRQLTRPGRARP